MKETRWSPFVKFIFRVSLFILNERINEEARSKEKRKSEVKKKVGIHWNSGFSSKVKVTIFILYLYYDERRDIRWNIAWARGKPQGRRLYFTVYPDLSQNTDILNILNYTSSIVFPGRALLEELILRIGVAAGAIFSRIAQ